MRYIKNENGSAMVTVIITVLVLIILGTSALAMSFMTYRLQAEDYYGKKAIYYSESGIDQVHALVSKYVDDIIVEAFNLSKDHAQKREKEIDEKIEELNKEIEAIREAYQEEDFDNLEEIEAKKQEIYEKYKPSRPSYIIRTGNDAHYNRANSLYLGKDDPQVEKTIYYSDSRDEFMETGQFAESLLKKNLAKFAENDQDYYIDKTRYSIKGNQIVPAQAGKQDLSKFIRLKRVCDDGGKIINVSLEKRSNLIADMTNEVFVYHYKRLLNERADELKEGIEDYQYSKNLAKTTKDQRDRENKFEILKDRIQISPFDDDNSSDIYRIKNISSKFGLKNRTTRRITTDIEIGLPKGTVAVGVSENGGLATDNPIWQTALVCNGDLIFENSTASIDGNVYVRGRTATSIKDTNSYGGLSLRGNKAGKVHVNGDITCGQNIDIKNTALNKELYIDDSYIFARNIAINEGASRSSINIKNSMVSVLDDLELNGHKAKINIDGSYCGLLDGGQASRPSYSHDQSSAIVVNSNLNDGSKLVITGKRPSIAGFSKLDFKGGLMLGGTGYIGAGGDSSYWPYQTGESIAIKGNYMAYFLNMDEIDIKGNKYSIIERTRPDGAPEGMEAIAKWDLSQGDRVLEGVDFKREYFKRISEDENYKGIINFARDSEGNRAVILDNIVYSTGNLIHKNGMYDFKSGEIDTYKPVRTALINKYSQHMTDLRTSNKTQLTSGGEDELENYITKIENADVLADKKFIDWSKDIKIDESSLDQVANDMLEAGFTGRELAIVDKNKQNYVLTKEAYSRQGDERVIRSDSGSFQGVLATKGNIIVNGDVKIHGSLIAGGDIKFINSDKAQIINQAQNLEYKTGLASLINKKSNLSQALNITNNDLGVIDLSQEVKLTINFDVANPNNIRQNIDSLVRLKHWRIN